MTETGPRDTRKSGNIAAARKKLTPERLVRDHASAVLGLCLAYTKNFHDSEDIVQDVFIQAFAKLDTLRDPTRVRPWLLKIARRKCIDASRKRRHSHPVTEDVPSQPNSGNEHLIHVHSAISKLPDAYRETITLYYLDGRDCAGVARSLGISEVAVRRRLVRARLMLHELLVEDES
ncbi:MAG: sigma-70 family RNA polymerase sigma factor [Sedimentisphaerales bacterium]|nr:sigma-70 family RNA polymerase sigma factor [Sedimentisphaerales bacterium]